MSTNTGGSGKKRTASTSAGRYASDLQRYAESLHQLGHMLPLSRVVIEPRFLPPPAIALPGSEDEQFDHYRVVPIIHDHPFLHADCALDTLTIDDLAGGSRALALLGPPGSGRTTALAAIVLHSLNLLTFPAPLDPVQSRLDSADAALSEKDRAVRVRERMLMEQRAQERSAQDSDQQASADEDAPALPPRSFRLLLPVLVHLRDLVPFVQADTELDPAEPLVRAVQSRLRPATARALPNVLYTQLAAGGCLVLIDGIDELSAADHATALDWLRAFLTHYPANRLIAAGPICGCGPLLDLGLTPVYVAPWNRQDRQMAASRLSTALAGQQRHDRAAENVQITQLDLTALYPEELIWRVLAAMESASDAAPAPSAWPQAALNRMLPERNSLQTPLPVLARLAARQLDEGRIQPQQIENAAQPADNTDNAAPAALLEVLRNSGLLRRYSDGSYAISQPRLTAWLASHWLSEAAVDEHSRRHGLPAWSLCAEYGAMHAPPAQSVQQRMVAAGDLAGDSILGMARWLAFAPADAAWRGSLMKRLSVILLAPSQYPLLRERAAAALLETRDPAALLIFRRAARSASPDLRRIGCIGMGALGGDEAVRDLRALLEDQQAEVRLAACIGLGAAGGEQALDGLVLMLTEGSEPLRQLAAEALACHSEAGWPLLHEAIQADDMLLRRAAIFGLRRLRTTWAQIEIYRALLGDAQWYVRSAAQQAYQERQSGRMPSPLAAPEPLHMLDGLRRWATKHGAQPMDDAAAGTLLKRMLREGTPKERESAAYMLGRSGAVAAVSTLYAALRDPEEAVRAAAHRALVELQCRTGIALPGIT